MGEVMEAFEDAYGETLDWFFYEWIVRDDLPTYVLDYSSRSDIGGSYIVEGTIAQEGEFYRTPVPLTIELGGWSYEENVAIDSAMQPFSLRTDAEPLQIVVDGSGAIPKIEPSDKAIEHHERGMRAAASGRWQVAADELGAAAFLVPSSAVYIHDYGEALVRLGLADEGIAYLRRSVELDVGSADYRFTLARLYMRLSDYGAALEQLDAFVRLRPNNRSGHVARAVALAGLGRLEEAESSIERVEGLSGGEQDPSTEAELLIARGMLQEAVGEIRAATRSYEAALAAYPVSDEARRRLRAIMGSNRQETE
jgi:tetratricopeptide (TPR) repeat protein